MEAISIKVDHLEKHYEKVQALGDISFEVSKGELFGVIGPDGAGKTTLFRILTSLLLASSGTATVEGLDVVKDYRKLRQILGYMPGRFSLYQDLTVEENLQFFATIFDTTITENYALIKDIYSQIEPFKTRRAGQLSGGMKQKLALSCAMIHKPVVLFLDEPTTGVDAVSRREFWDMLIHLKKSGMTIMVSTPYMDEAELCDRVALMQDGAIMQLDTPANIKASFNTPVIAVKSDSMYVLMNDLQSYPDIDTLFPFGEFLHYTAKSGAPDIEHMKTYLKNKGHANPVLMPVSPNIEDCFMRLMKHKEAQP